MLNILREIGLLEVSERQQAGQARCIKIVVSYLKQKLKKYAQKSMRKVMKMKRILKDQMTRVEVEEQKVMDVETEEMNGE